jgi:hypothetical protein
VGEINFHFLGSGIICWERKIRAGPFLWWKMEVRKGIFYFQVLEGGLERVHFLVGYDD